MFSVLLFLQNFLKVPERKKERIDNALEQAVMWKKEDALNKNGTTDVESKWVWLEGWSFCKCVWLKL